MFLRVGVGRNTSVNVRVLWLEVSCLEDMNLISKDDATKVVDKNKIRREVSKNRRQLQEAKTIENVPIKGLYFDGRKEETMFQEKNRRGN